MFWPKLIYISSYNKHRCFGINEYISSYNEHRCFGIDEYISYFNKHGCFGTHVSTMALIMNTDVLA